MLGLLDWIVLIVYFVLVVALGAKFSKSNESEEDYFVGGRSFKWGPIALSIIATQVSAVTFLGAPGWAYTDGLTPIILNLNVPLVMWFIGGTIAPFFYNMKVVSIYEYLEKRFGFKIRAIMAVAFMFKAVMVIGTIVYAPALVLSTITGIAINVTIAIMAIVAILYTIMGGIKAVIWTDVIQMLILWVGLALALIIIIKSLPNGLSNALEVAKEAGKLKALDFTPGFTKGNTFWAGIIGGGILHLAYFGIDQAQAQRYLSAKSMKNVKFSLNFTGIVIAAQMFVFMIIGSFLYVYYNGKTFANPNDIFITFALENIPTGILGLIIAAIFAAAMSSIDSALNSISTVYVRDIYKKFINPNASTEKMMKVSKGATMVWGALIGGFAFLVSNSKLSILEAVSKYGSYLLGSMLAVFLLGMYTKKVNEKGVLVGFFVGVLTVAFVAQNTGVNWMWNNLIGLTITTMVSYLISMLTGHEKKQVAMYTVPGQKEYFEENKLDITEDGVFVLPGKFEKSSYILLGYFILIIAFFYFLGA